jgi:hypothetical protein
VRCGGGGKEEETERRSASVHQCEKASGWVLMYHTHLNLHTICNILWTVHKCIYTKVHIYNSMSYCPPSLPGSLLCKCRVHVKVPSARSWMCVHACMWSDLRIRVWKMSIT